MTIHHEHPFADPASARQPVRRFRGRMALPVTVWTAGLGAARVGWTVSSVLVADGEPAEALGLVDEDSDLAEALHDGDRLVINLLGPAHRGLADAFAGQAPAPGGLFTLGSWSETDWGPVLQDTPGWLGVRVSETRARVGWSTLVRGAVEQVDLDDGTDEVLGYLHGRYRTWDL